MAACVAVISDTNQLLYLRTAECSDPLFYHFKVHAALDVIEEKLLKRSNAGPDHSDQYLGLLYPMENHRLYGYVTNTKIKFIIIQEAQPPPVSATGTTSGASSPGPNPQSPTQLSTTATRDTDIRNLFLRLHKAYVDLVSCPFYECRTPILPDHLPAAARFDQQVRDMLAPRASSGICPILATASLGVEMLTSPPTSPVPIKP